MAFNHSMFNTINHATSHNQSLSHPARSHDMSPRSHDPQAPPPPPSSLPHDPQSPPPPPASFAAPLRLSQPLAAIGRDPSLREPSASRRPSRPSPWESRCRCPWLRESSASRSPSRSVGEAPQVAALRHGRAGAAEPPSVACRGRARSPPLLPQVRRRLAPPCNTVLRFVLFIVFP